VLSISCWVNPNKLCFGACSSTFFLIVLIYLFFAFLNLIPDSVNVYGFFPSFLLETSLSTVFPPILCSLPGFMVFYFVFSSVFVLFSALRFGTKEIWYLFLPLHCSFHPEG
jgi:hypothetical protein